MARRYLMAIVQFSRRILVSGRGDAWPAPELLMKFDFDRLRGPPGKILKSPPSAGRKLLQDLRPGGSGMRAARRSAARRERAAVGPEQNLAGLNQDYNRVRISPSCTTDTTSSPCMVNSSPRASPRAPAATGDSCA